MPRKIRELKAQIARAGFVQLPKRGKGSHERWRHPKIKETMTIPGKDGSDVPRYLEKQRKQKGITSSRENYGSDVPRYLEKQLTKLLSELDKLEEEDS